MKTSLAKYSGFNLVDTPPYMANRNCSEASSFQIVNEMREKVLEGISYSNALTYYKENIVIKFGQLSSEVISDCIFTSSPTTIQKHPAYTQIIALGKTVIPLLIQSLETTPTFWFPALRILADSNPVKPENKGMISNMTNDWKIWAIDNGYTQ